MTRVFVDTVALLALWDTLDQWHEAAEAAFARAYHENWTLVTTSFILLETGNAVARKSYRESLLDLRREFSRAQNLIVPLDEDWEGAWAAFAKHDAADAGIVDLTSFQVMRRLGITAALTNDGHFRAAGFETLM